MFTGIVEERGRVVARRGSRLVIEAGATSAKERHAGREPRRERRMPHRGRAIDGERDRFDLGPETLARTALGDLRTGIGSISSGPCGSAASWAAISSRGTSTASVLVAAVATDGETARIRVEWQDAALAPLLIPRDRWRWTA